MALGSLGTPGGHLSGQRLALLGPQGCKDCNSALGDRRATALIVSSTATVENIDVSRRAQPEQISLHVK